MKKLSLILGIIILFGCSNMRYEKSISINAPKAIVFGILEDYENYPNIIPEFHANVRIISKNKTGLGVQFINNSTFGGYKIESTYEVTEYRFNEYIKMENKSQYGSTELVVSEIGNNETLYTLINYVKIPNSMKNKLYSAFDKELETIKTISENTNINYNFEFPYELHEKIYSELLSEYLKMPHLDEEFNVLFK
jgi:ribosome-associated toxin RatA of RatAB toxin-antitoxin module